MQISLKDDLSQVMRSDGIARRNLKQLRIRCTLGRVRIDETTVCFNRLTGCSAFGAPARDWNRTKPWRSVGIFEKPNIGRTQPWLRDHPLVTTRKRRRMTQQQQQQGRRKTRSLDETQRRTNQLQRWRRRRHNPSVAQPQTIRSPPKSRRRKHGLILRLFQPPAIKRWQQQQQQQGQPRPANNPQTKCHLTLYYLRKKRLVRLTTNPRRYIVKITWRNNIRRYRRRPQ